ncbi:MAG: pyruvate kinase, partial [Patescibacteria group bacterium]
MEKRTKIVATISDMNCDVSFLQSLFDAGVNVFRTNTAHQQPEDTLKILNNVRAVSKTAPVMVDTKGPEIRTTPLKDQEVPVKTGDKLIFKGGSKELTSAKTIYLNYDGFHKNIDNGASILYDDGEIEFKVVEKHSDHLVVEVLNDGVIKGKKSVNVPGVSLNLPSLTEKDKMYVKFVAENDVDFIAHSFIRHKEDLKAVQDILDEHKSSAKIIAKIENQEGVDNIDEILDNCAGIMVARGDLAIEIPTERVPPIQKRLIKRAIEKRKIVITATQMLHTMIDNPRPTRAEVSDVA